MKWIILFLISSCSTFFAYSQEEIRLNSISEVSEGSDNKRTQPGKTVASG